LYNGQQIIETRDGSNNVVQQLIHGMQYIDELVMVRVKNKGDLYVHQDANWNVIGLTDLGGRLVERYVYTPYGELTVHQSTGYGDRDGDGTVDSVDKGTPGTTCTGTVSGECRILDLDFDGDYDSTDASLFDSLPQGLAQHPSRTFTGIDQPFAHQGLLYDAEIMTYQNRARQYAPSKRRFAQRTTVDERNSIVSPFRTLLNSYAFKSSNSFGEPMGFPERTTTALQAGMVLIPGNETSGVVANSVGNRQAFLPVSSLHRNRHPIDVPVDTIQVNLISDKPFFFVSPTIASCHAFWVHLMDDCDWGPCMGPPEPGYDNIWCEVCRYRAYRLWELCILAV